MARSRNIKPGFFLNDKLADVEPLGRILFAGLWCIADRKGRLKDRPRRIKAEVLPYDNCDLDDLLNQLVKHGFIIRYEVDGEAYIQVTNFMKHQNPHKNERDSEIPAPDCSHTSTIQAPDKQTTSAESISADGEKQEKQTAKKAVNHGPLDDSHTSTIQAPEHSDTNPADSLNLIPDSRTRRTDSPSGTGVKSTDDGDNGNSALKKIYDAFSENIHPITPFEAETLGAWVDDGMEPDAIIWAIRQAVLQGKRTAKYIDAIIRNLHTENITTAAGAEARERNRADAKRQEPGRAREPTRLSPEEKERIAELNRQLAESMDINKAVEEVPPWEREPQRRTV